VNRCGVRLFFAIWLPDEVIDWARGVQAALHDRAGADGLRWEDPGKLHITLQFLGEVAEERLDAARHAALSTASRCRRFHLTLAGLGAFPAGRRPRVLWIGAEEGVPEFVRLTEYLYRELAAREFNVTGKWVAPHVTLARVKSEIGERAVKRCLSENISVELDKKRVVSVYNIVLVQSELRPQGSVYTLLDTFPLAAG
jgi:2'-5' RNA ligase